MAGERYVEIDKVVITGAADTYALDFQDPVDRVHALDHLGANARRGSVEQRVDRLAGQAPGDPDHDAGDEQGGNRDRL